MLARADSAETTVSTPQPGELWSLWMLYEYAAVYANIATSLEQCRTSASVAGLEGRTMPQDEQDRILHILISLRHVAELSEKHFPPLKRLHLRLSRLILKMDTPLQVVAMRTELDNLRDGLSDELSGEKFLAVSAELAQFYTTEQAFGSEVSAAFPNALTDIDEAGKCLALGRNKAAVFHLMLAMEEALRTLADKIGADVFDVKKDQFYPWAVIAGHIKDKISALPKAEQDSWTEVHALLWSVNKAWRNKTMHPAQGYTDTQAKRLYEAVRHFMSDLAELV